MVVTQREVLCVLIHTLLDKGLIARTMYDRALHIINSSAEFPDFFEYGVCCLEEDEKNGSPQN